MHYPFIKAAAIVVFVAAVDGAPHGERLSVVGDPVAALPPTAESEGETARDFESLEAMPKGSLPNAATPSGNFQFGGKATLEISGPNGEKTTYDISGLNGEKGTYEISGSNGAPSRDKSFGSGLAALASQLEGLLGLNQSPSSGAGPAPSDEPDCSTSTFPPGAPAYPTNGFGFPGGNRPPPDSIPSAGPALPTGGSGHPGGDEQPSGDAPSSTVPTSVIVPTPTGGSGAPENEQPPNDTPPNTPPAAGIATPTGKPEYSGPAPTEPATLQSTTDDINTVSFVFPTETAGGGGFGFMGP